ncbi:terpene synthase family protein [Nocardia inohanensis]|uniref:terpene synthase family protein n=1 Tax=Nocardia inohanensis TaxID=209246 RepID=UPI000A751182|nr:terpene synthase family protein [Nocardia inohanensis]
MKSQRQMKEIMTAVERLPREEVFPSPHVDHVRKQVLRWARRYGLDAGGHFERTCCWSCAAYALPGAPVQVVELAAKLIGWMFVFDDIYGEGTDPTAAIEVFDACERVLRGEAPRDDNRYLLALSDFRDGCARLAGEAWLDRFATDMRMFFHGCLFEMPYRQMDLMPSPGAYRYLRTFSIGLFPPFDLIELAYGEIAPAHVRLFRDVRQTSAVLCAIVNDLYSTVKEDDSLNYVTILRADTNLTVALDDIVALYTELLDQQTAQIAELTAHPDLGPAERKVARSLRTWVHGNYAWTKLCTRYHPPAIAV